MQNARWKLALWTGAWLCLQCHSLLAAEPGLPGEPIFRTGVPNATQDKPQSKLWHAQGRWWAWLPIRGGSTILERVDGRWRELSNLRSHLAGLPGQADVWADVDSVRAVLVGDNRLAAVELRFDSSRDTYIAGPLRHEFELPPKPRDADPLETATICRDRRNRWWIAHDRDRSVTLLWTTDEAGLAWSPPFSLAGETSKDDICSLFALPDRVGVLWSDQVTDAVFFREHLDSDEPGRWGETIVVDRGGQTADDHIHGTLAADGTLYVATKNSVDTIGKPQHVLRVRRPDGRWENLPYANLEERLAPTRPITQVAGSPQQLILLETIHDRSDPNRRQSYIVWRSTPLTPLNLWDSGQKLLVADRPLNNVTGSKCALPAAVPCLVVASDDEGNVYEAVVPLQEGR